MKVNKKAWILAQDKSLAASELVRRARKEGFRLDPGYVHMTRYHARKKVAAVSKLRSSAPASVPAIRSGVADRAVQVQFLNLIRRAGTINASKWLQEIRTAEI